MMNLNGLPSPAILFTNTTFHLYTKSVQIDGFRQYLKCFFKNLISLYIGYLIPLSPDFIICNAELY